MNQFELSQTTTPRPKKTTVVALNGPDAREQAARPVVGDPLRFDATVPTAGCNRLIRSSSAILLQRQGPPQHPRHP
jgi:hypothetical protein